jgi:sigma-E factor negative regulatory protein RseC
VAVFLLPCIGLGAGYVLGQSLFQLGDVSALGTAALGLFIGFLPAVLMNRAISRSQAPEFRILKFLS